MTGKGVKGGTRVVSEQDFADAWDNIFRKKDNHTHLLRCIKTKRKLFLRKEKYKN